jgi:hypothetical protein
MFFSKSFLILITFILITFAGPSPFDYIQIDSVILKAWDIDFSIKDTTYSYTKKDSISVKLDNKIFREIIKNADETYEIIEGVIIPPPRSFCGDLLSTRGIVMCFGNADKFKLELSLGCPNSSLHGEISFNSKNYGISLNNKIQTKLKGLINKSRLSIFKKNRLWESSHSILTENYLHLHKK